MTDQPPEDSAPKSFMGKPEWDGHRWLSWDGTQWLWWDGTQWSQHAASSSPGADTEPEDPAPTAAHRATAPGRSRRPTLLVAAVIVMVAGLAVAAWFAFARSSAGNRLSGNATSTGAVFLHGPFDESNTCSGLGQEFRGDVVEVQDNGVTIGTGTLTSAYADQGTSDCMTSAPLQFKTTAAELQKVRRTGHGNDAVSTDLTVKVAGHPRVAVTMIGGNTVLFYDPSDESITYAADLTADLAGRDLPMPH